MRSPLLCFGVVLLLPWCLLACGTDARPAASVPPVVPGDEVAATADAAAPSPLHVPSSAAASPRVAGPPLTGLHATAAMKLEGNVDADKLVAAINTQVTALQRCVSVIRTSDKVVGSLNLQITLAQDGKVATELQSPLNAAAERCMLDGVGAWRVTGAGTGKAMLLLSLE